MIAHWSGKGNMFEMENYRKFFHREVNGILEQRPPLEESPGLFNRVQIRCQMSMNIEPKTKAPDSFETCTMPTPLHTKSSISGCPAKTWRRRVMEIHLDAGNRQMHRDFRHNPVSVPHGNRDNRIRSHPR